MIILFSAYHRGGGGARGRGGGGPHEKIKFDTEFDFDKANELFLVSAYLVL